MLTALGLIVAVVLGLAAVTVAVEATIRTTR